MDKYEYKLRSEEIRTLIAKGEYVEAAEIADAIDWRRVKSVMMLCTISDLYKINRRFEDSKELLMLAHERHPGGRTIIYSLCELAIKMGEFVQAIEFYKTFVQIAPKDSGRYILQYKLYCAQEVSLEERIDVLDEMKKRDYREKWAYELAYLYHRVGLATKCVEECDELVLWFGEGKYVTKAMELKMLHQALTPEQQAKYEGRFGEYLEESGHYHGGLAETRDEDNPIDLSSAPTVEISSGELDDIQVQTMDVGQYNTINLQKELADSMKDLWEMKPHLYQEPVDTEEFFSDNTGEIETQEYLNDTEEYDQIEQEEEIPEEVYETVEEISEEIVEETEEITEEAIEEVFEEVSEEEIIQEDVSGDENQAITKSIVAPLLGYTQEITGIEEALLLQETGPLTAEAPKPFAPKVVNQPEPVIREEMPLPELIKPVFKMPPGMDKIIGMEYDGQMSLVVPDSEQVEKQITGQMNIEEILSEWEKVKKQNEEKRAEGVRQLVLQHTGNILVDFDEAAKAGLLEQLVDTSEIIDSEPNQALEEVVDEADEIETVNDVVEIEIEIETVDEIEEVELVEDIEILNEAEKIEEASENIEISENLDSKDKSVDVEINDLPEDESMEELPAEERPVEESQVQEDHKEQRENNEQTVRQLTKEEKELFGSFIQNRKAKEQIITAVDEISLAAYTGNVIITGEEGMNTLTLAKNMMREVQMTDVNFSGKIAKISGDSLNKRDIQATISKIVNGALIIENAGAMESETVAKLEKSLQQDSQGIVVVLEGTKKSIQKLLDTHETLANSFTARVDIEALDNDALVSFGRKYAREREYSIDEMGLLALHTKISDNQTSDHSVTILEVKEMVDLAIAHANRKTVGHLFDILLAKRYDKDDMIILREWDFD